MGCNSCKKSRAERVREKQKEKLIKEGYSEKQAESFLPKAVKPNLRWLQFFSVSSVVFLIGWILMETLIYVLSSLWNLLF